MTLVEDDIIEPTEVITASVGSMQDPYTSDFVPKMIRILDNDKPEVSVRPVRGSVNEGEDVVFEVTVHDDPADIITVVFDIRETHQPPVYMDTGSLTVAKPFTSAGTFNFSVNTLMDRVDDPRRMVVGRISSSSRYDIRGHHSAQVWVDDDLPRVSIVSDGDVDEGAAASFTLTSFPVPTSPLSVKVSVDETGFFGVDTADRTVTIDSTGSAKLTVPTTRHVFGQPAGAVTATIQSPDDGTYYPSPGSGQSAATAKITDHDDTNLSVKPAVLGAALGHANNPYYLLVPRTLNLWKRVLLAFGQNPSGVTGGPMTAAEAQTYADQGITADWGDVAAELRRLEAIGFTQPVVIVTAEGDITEGGDARFTLRALPGPVSDRNVEVTVAAEGSFGVTTGTRTVTIPAKGTATLTVATSHDGIAGDDGSITVTVVDGAAYDVYSKPSVSVAVADFGGSLPPVVGITGGGDITEGGDATFTLTASPPPAAAFDVTVTVSVTGDFGVVAGSRTVTVGTGGTGTLTLATAGDGADEPDGTVTAALVDGAAYDLDSSASSASVVVADDDDPAPVVGITAGGGVVEGANAVFTLSASPAPSAAFDVAVSVSVTGDFGVVAGGRTVTIPTSGTATFTIPTTGDAADEPDGTVTAALVDGAAYDVDSNSSSATVDVADDDDPPVVPCAVAAPSDDLVRRVRGYHDLNSPKPGYSQNWLRVLIAFGVETSNTLQPFTAAEARSAEQVWDGWTPVREELERIEQAAAQCTPPPPTPVVGITAGGGVVEGANAVFTVTAASAPAAAFDVTVTVSVTGDFGVVAGSRTVTVGTGGTGTLTLATAGDGADEPDGTVTAALVDGAAYDLDSSASSASVVVADDDDPAPVVGITAGGGVVEGANAVFTLSASPAPSAAFDVVVSVSVTGDFGVVAGGRTVTIPTSGTATFTIPTTGDAADEPDGTVTAALVDGAAYDVDSNSSSATVDVADDDDPPVVPCAVAAPSDDLVRRVRGYHDLNSPKPGYSQNWLRVLIAFGVETSNTLQPFTAAEARSAEQVWDGWTPVREELERIEQAAAQCTPPPPTPVVGITAGGGVVEGANAVFTVTAASAPAAAFDVTVTVSVTGDFGVVAGSRTVTVGTGGTGTLTLATAGDGADEPDGTVTAALVDGAAYDLDSSASSASVVVADDDDPAPVVGITAGGGVVEGANAVFTLSASPAPSAAFDVAVSVSVTGDFGVVAGGRTVTIPTSGTATFTIPTTGDAADEPDGTVTAALVDGAAYDVDSNSSSATVDVADDDDPPVVPCAVAAPSDDLVRRVRGYHDLNSPKPGYSQNWLRVLIAFGVETSNTLQPFTAAEARSAEQVWDGWTPVREELERIEQAAAQCTPPPPTPVVGITAGGGVVEGANAVFTVTAASAPAAAFDVTVTVSVTGDFGVVAGSRTVTVGTGGTGTLTLATASDGADEPDGTVTAALVDGAAYDVDSTAGTATVAVADDDDPAPPPTPVVGITAGGGVVEGANAVFTVTAASAPAAAFDVTVTVSVTGDFGVVAGSRTVTVGTGGTGTLTLATAGDGADEPDGTVTAALVDGAAYDLDSNSSSATVAVADDDDPPVPVGGPVVALEGASAAIGESGGGYGFYVVWIALDEPVDHPVSVYLTYQLTGVGDGHAAADDFTVRSGRVTIPAGYTRNAGGVWITEDDDQEPDETLRVLISDPRGAVIGNSQTILTIKDND